MLKLSISLSTHCLKLGLSDGVEGGGKGGEPDTSQLGAVPSSCYPKHALHHRHLKLKVCGEEVGKSRHTPMTVSELTSSSLDESTNLLAEGECVGE